MESIKTKVRTIPDFPKPGIQFRDITTLLADPEGFRETMDILTSRYQNYEIDIIAAIEARGFILGAALADRLQKGLVLIRKPGKLPSQTLGVDYDLEYGTDRLEMHVDAITAKQRVLVVDDLLATGGTMAAACRLIEKAGGQVVECVFVIALPELNGQAQLSSYPIFSIISFEGE